MKLHHKQHQMLLQMESWLLLQRVMIYIAVNEVIILTVGWDRWILCSVTRYITGALVDQNSNQQVQADWVASKWNIINRWSIIRIKQTWCWLSWTYNENLSSMEGVINNSSLKFVTFPANSCVYGGMTWGLTVHWDATRSNGFWTPSGFFVIIYRPYLKKCLNQVWLSQQCFLSIIRKLNLM